MDGLHVSELESVIEILYCDNSYGVNECLNNGVLLIGLSMNLLKEGNNVENDHDSSNNGNNNA